MRTYEVRQAVISTIEGITPDTKATAADKFYLLPVDSEELTRDRGFQVRYTELVVYSGRLLFEADSVTTSMEIAVAYLSQSESAHTRIAQDSDLILEALEGLAVDPTLNPDSQIINVEITSAAVEYVDTAGMLLTYSLTIEFDPRDP